MRRHSPIIISLFLATAMFGCKSRTNGTNRLADTPTPTARESSSNELLYETNGENAAVMYESLSRRLETLQISGIRRNFSTEYVVEGHLQFGCSTRTVQQKAVYSCSSEWLRDDVDTSDLQVRTPVLFHLDGEPAKLMYDELTFPEKPIEDTLSKSIVGKNLRFSCIDNSTPTEKKYSCSLSRAPEVTRVLSPVARQQIVCKGKIKEPGMRLDVGADVAIEYNHGKNGSIMVRNPGSRVSFGRTFPASECARFNVVDRTTGKVLSYGYECRTENDPNLGNVEFTLEENSDNTQVLFDFEGQRYSAADLAPINQDPLCTYR